MAAYTFPNPKDPRDVSKHSFDATKFLATTETIDSASVTVAPAGLGVSEPIVSGKLISFILSGGSAGVTYAVTVEITTADGAIYNRSAELVVEDL